jgi:hypothetical protein
MRAVKCLSVGKTKLVILHRQISKWVFSQNDREEQLSASPGAPWNRYVTPGDELNALIEAILSFILASLASV